MWTFKPHSELQNWQAEFTTRSASKAAESRVRSMGDGGVRAGSSAFAILLETSGNILRPAAPNAVSLSHSRRSGGREIGSAIASLQSA
jgi:hypothetical protein